MFRPDAPLLPNYKWIPIGYHGRSSSIGVSGQKFNRPVAQVRTHPDEPPSLMATRRLDFELELGVFIGSGNTAGDAVPLNRAEQHAFGVVLLNDWSARDVQAWEYQPLGPFLSKNFATTISPWMVTMEALAPFRTPGVPRAPGDPEPLPYLTSSHNQQYGGIDIQLEVWLETPQMRRTSVPAARIVQSSFAAAYWTLAQMITHHTVNGCNLQSGDLLGTGTQSGPLPENAGSLLELSVGGKRPLRLHTGESRTFIEDDDAVNLKAFCAVEGARRIGFGDCKGQVLPATTTHTVVSS
jgi:fumarylacetoacetase